MPRVKKGSATRQARKRVLKRVRGYVGAKGHLYRLAKEAAIRAQRYAFDHRKQKKRLYRGMWVIRLNAACKERGLRYSQFIDGCKKANIVLNRKMLSQIAIEDQAGFDAITAAVKKALGL